MHVRPLHDRILVQRLDEGEQHNGGIIIPDSAKEKPQRGTVIAAGTGRVNEDGERETLMRDNTRKLYMAATRAGQRLVITYVGELPIVLKGLAGKSSDTTLM
jgi:co-chaperonin GroES (HSP10)